MVSLSTLILGVSIFLAGVPSDFNIKSKEIFSMHFASVYRMHFHLKLNKNKTVDAAVFCASNDQWCTLLVKKMIVINYLLGTGQKSAMSCWLPPSMAITILSVIFTSFPLYCHKMTRKENQNQVINISLNPVIKKPRTHLFTKFIDFKLCTRAQASWL